MKLFELITATPDRLTPRAAPKSLPTDKINRYGSVEDPDKDVEAIGSGSFGTAYSSTREPGTVTKVVHSTDLEHDAYFQYVSMLLKYQRSDSNPYFPKIYDVHPFKEPEGSRHSFTVEMERLHDLDTLSPKEVSSIGDKIFYNYKQLASRTIVNKKRYQAHRKMSWETSEAREHEDVGVLIGLIKKTVDIRWGPAKKLFSMVKDPDLKKAILLIRKIQNELVHSFFDLHVGNFMVRRGPTGPHLVITDPLAR